MSNLLVAVIFLLFLFGPALIAAAAVQERFDLLRDGSRLLLRVASLRWLPQTWPWLKGAVRDWMQEPRLPFPELRSALWRLWVSAVEMPPDLWRFAVYHVHHTSVRVVYRPDAGTLSSRWYRLAMVDRGSSRFPVSSLK